MASLVGIDRQQSNVRRDRLLDGLAVAAIICFVAFLSGAQRFTFLHTVDSEFYFSLGAFGSQVTDRAPFDQYFWTKFGLNLPVRLLTQVTDPWTARLVWRLLLLLSVVGSTFAVARPRASRVGAAAAALFVALNTAVVGHIGDPYFAGTTIALLCLAIALTHHILFSRGGLPAAGALGGTVAWIVMTNPYGILICIGSLIGMMSARLLWLARLGLLRLELLMLSAIAGFVMGMAIFLAWGRHEFPDRDWLPYVKGFILTAPMDSWAEKGWEWLGTETSLLVPLAAALVTLGIRWLALRRPAGPALGAAVGLVLLPGLLALTYKLISGSAVLETSYYSALLWPPALLGLVMAATTVSTGHDSRAMSWLALVGSTAAWIAAGHLPGPYSPTALAVLSLATCLIVVVSVRHWPVREALAIVMVLGVPGLIFQIDQNGRPPRASTLSHDRIAYSNAYRPSDTAQQLRRDLAFEAWLIDQTGPNADVFLWAPEEVVHSMAGMQLWGPNRLFTDDDGVVRHLYDRTPAPKPGDTIVTLSSRSAQSSSMEARLREIVELTEPSCAIFALPGDPSDVAHACILKPVG